MRQAGPMAAQDIDLLRLPLDEQDVEVSLVDLARLGDPESAAARFLTPKEREEYRGLRHPGRRREWLAARVCLKTMLVRRGCISDPIQCEIGKDARGRPWLSFAPAHSVGHEACPTDGRPRTAVHDCSLSHKAD